MMKVSSLMVIGALVLGANCAFGVPGWVDTGISSESMFLKAQSDMWGETPFFEEKAPKTDFWFPIRVGLGGGKNSTTNKVFSIPYVWSDVYGVQLELLSCACDVYGIQLCAAGAGSNVNGLQMSLGNYVFREMNGIQLGLAFSDAKYMKGLQINGFCSMTDEMRGLQFGLLSSGSRTYAKGVQLAGLVNVAHECNGVQIGLVNIAAKGSVLQIGLWNIYGEEGENQHSQPLICFGKE